MNAPQPLSPVDLDLAEIIRKHGAVAVIESLADYVYDKARERQRYHPMPGLGNPRPWFNATCKLEDARDLLREDWAAENAEITAAEEREREMNRLRSERT